MAKKGEEDVVASTTGVQSGESSPVPVSSEMTNAEAATEWRRILSQEGPNFVF